VATEQLIQQGRSESEGEPLDFKSEQYRFVSDPAATGPPATRGYLQEATQYVGRHDVYAWEQEWLE